jgi:hypothetical protein
MRSMTWSCGGVVAMLTMHMIVEIIMRTLITLFSVSNCILFNERRRRGLWLLTKDKVLA